MKTGPVEKIYEAFSAIADDRVRFISEEGCLMPTAQGVAKVTSSDGNKTYTVTWQGEDYTSNDNATYWQGYAGYPVIAVLMLQGRLPLDRSISDLFKGINWTELNNAHKRDYSAALDEIIDKRGIDRSVISGVVQETYSLLGALPVNIGKGKMR
ncbi:hypothetical protein E4T81_04370 [Barnesiella sp. WM24]|uniref:hypothetical protein n=1 Tax=Barnesiella sp. WM24 TaxID=2558278 RepID=UPI000ABC9680|nr:hypothetical protein [Barnesiella sp. WM24]TFU94484.1 hypothetical protein E4T81_04370 [Barnesiella sp. WM24]